MKYFYLFICLFLLSGCAKCVEYKKYCYYTESTSSFGSMVSTSGKVGMGTVYGARSIYFPCSQKDVYPNAQEESKCVRYEKVK